MAKKKSKILEIKQVRSGIKRPKKQRRTLVALGLTHHQKVVTRPDNPQVRGMIQKVIHLVEVREINDK